MTTSAKILKGTIIFAEMLDPVTNEPAGKHPGVVLNPQVEIDAGADLVVAVCSTAFQPMQSGWFTMPASPGGHPDTGLDQACVVKATWLQTIPQDKVLKQFKRAPASVFKQVVNWLQEKKRQIPPRSADEPR